ncbi:MAG: bifunctional phosphopantothenoylcysteine decarboxylase/phosphopantothenate--cysteine ligase CoaBC [Deltaproteobacteria bacterium]|nr:bifunctional phosphopantothenoylcysteine decarboxylase/phosphopantothenate--cysteine ligase CoaBC [Deltaproteobacteria bacterium]
MSMSLKGLHILLGVTGGIAAYKSAELCRLFVKAGATVQVVMSEAACQFITPLTLETLSGRPVPVTMFHRTRGPLEHIDLPTEADLMVIAPATADYLARCATGRAEDLISSVTLAFAGPVLAAPAMNTIMYNNPATQRNLYTLKQLHGWSFVEPGEGDLACGTTGKGRMASPFEILSAVERLQCRDLEGKTVVVTAGPTVEDIDPVRYISNRSSGKTGYAIAERAQQRGAKVHLISGPVSLSAPAGCNLIRVRSAENMKQAVFQLADDADAVIMCAAVADYRPAKTAVDKIKKEDMTHIALTRNPDILAELGEKFGGQNAPVRIGFALETEQLAQHAHLKLEQKGAHAIVANLAADALEGDRTRATIFLKNGKTIESGDISKRDLADIVLNVITELQ